jgi:hypothetical protein
LKFSSIFNILRVKCDNDASWSHFLSLSLSLFSLLFSLTNKILLSKNSEHINRCSFEVDFRFISEITLTYRIYSNKKKRQKEENFCFWTINWIKTSNKLLSKKDDTLNVSRTMKRYFHILYFTHHNKRNNVHRFQ